MGPTHGMAKEINININIYTYIYIHMYPYIHMHRGPKTQWLFVVRTERHASGHAAQMSENPGLVSQDGQTNKSTNPNNKLTLRRGLKTQWPVPQPHTQINQWKETKNK